VQHRIKARAPRDADAPRTHDDPALVAPFLSDAAHVSGGFAAGVTFPTNEAEVAAVVARAAHVLPVGAQSSLTGGATPKGEIVLSTRALIQLEAQRSGHVRVGAGVPITSLQAWLANSRLWYPPAPTFEGAFVGGTIATNAAGAATFKYGSTRPWVAALTVVLANGELLDIERGQVTTPPGGLFEIVGVRGDVMRVRVPTYVMPRVAKLSAGYYSAAPETDLIDLFVGAEGTLGVIVDASLRVVSRPERVLALLACAGETQAIAVTRALRDEAVLAWRDGGPLDVSAIEYMDAASLAALGDDDFGRAAVERPPEGSVLLLVQIEVRGAEDAALERLSAILDACGVDANPRVALPGDERGAAQLSGLREAVPAAVNAAVAAAKARVNSEIEKTAADMVVPFDAVEASLAVYREAFAARRLRCAIWGHLSDGNLHPNVIPESLEDVEHGREAILEIARRISAMGGAPLAEHGVGRNPLKQRLLRELYGEDGIEQMRAVKRALDPGWKLAPGVLFPPA
jgi:D-lactate dehydrogenase (cytochrome)